MNKGLVRWLLISLLGLCLTGCGLHMRGAVNIPPEYQKVQLLGDDKSDLYRMVASRLKRVGVQLVEGDSNVPQLTLGAIQVTNQVASVDSHSQAVEYIMLFNTKYSLAVPGHETQSFNASFNRSFINKYSEALASSREQEQLTHEMLEQTADLILIQLSRLKY